jgi:ABC-type glycerol-3-phosphate transport system substrate-binding protein
MIKQTRRRLMGTAMAGTGLVLLAACRPGGGADAGPKPGGSGKQVTLRVGARAAAVAGNPSWEEFQAGKQLFESKYPNLTVEVTPDMNSEKFLAAAAAGDAWDVQDLCCDQIPLEARAGVLMKLDPFIRRGMKEADIKDWIAWQYKYFNIDGAQYGMGKYMGTTALYYNKDWFQQKGVALPDDTWDWNKYREAMVRLTDVPNKQWGAYLILGGDRRQAKVHQNGGHMVDPSSDLKSMLDHPKTIEAYEWIHARMWRENSAIQPDQRPETTPGTPVNARLLFTGGTTAMWEDGSWSLVPVIQDKPAFEWDVVTLPKGPVQRSVLATTDGWAMWAQTKHVDDTWLLFTWYNSDDWYGIQSRRLQPARLSWLPKWQSLLTETYPELKGKNLKAFTMGAEEGFARPWELHRYHAAVNKLINDEYTASVERNQRPVRDTHIELARQVNEIQAKEHQASGAGAGK